MINKRMISIAAGVVISLLFLIGAFYNVNAEAFFLSLKDIHSSSLVFCAVFIFLSYITKAFMWRITTRSMRKIDLSTLFGGIAVGCMVNGILPFRAGELFRAHYLSSMTGLRRTTVLSTIFIERTLDVNSLSLFLILSLFLGIHSISLKTAGIIFLIWLIVMVTAGFFIVHSKNLEQKKHKLAFIPQRLREAIFNFLAPLNQLREMKKTIPLIIISILSWICTYVSLLALIYYSGATIKYEAALVLLLFVNIGFLIPAVPGALGIMQLAFWFSLSQFGVQKEQALALSFAYLFVAYFFNTGVGLPYFLRAHLWAQRDLLREERQS